MMYTYGTVFKGTFFMLKYEDAMHVFINAAFRLLFCEGDWETASTCFSVHKASASFSASEALQIEYLTKLTFAKNYILYLML